MCARSGFLEGWNEPSVRRWKFCKGFSSRGHGDDASSRSYVLGLRICQTPIRQTFRGPIFGLAAKSE